MRNGVEEEEITPPCVKVRSFDSLSVAHILGAGLDPKAAAAAEGSSSASGSMLPPLAPVETPLPGASTTLPSPDSPSLSAAAAILQSTSSASSSREEDSASLLMSLAGAASSAEGSGERSQPPTVSKGLKRSAEEVGGGAGATRRRLKMKEGGGANHAAARNRVRDPKGLRQSVTVAPADPNLLLVTGVEKPVRILSGASLLQLKLLSAAFQLCPQPTPEQLLAIARHVAVSPEKLETWFQSRRTLQEWVHQQPHLSPADLATMFYPEAAPDAPYVH